MVNFHAPPGVTFQQKEALLIQRRLSRKSGEELLHLSNGIPQNEFETLDLRREHEFELVRNADAIQNASCWYIIDAAWIKKWILFIYHDGELPGPISNGHLLNESKEPIPGLEPVTDYRC
jgi:hypothetical protein